MCISVWRWYIYTKYYNIIYIFIVPQYMNITTKCSTLKLLFFSFSSCLTIEQSMVFKTMDRQCESFSRIISSGLDKSLYLFGTLGLHRLLTKTLKFLKNLKIKKISKNFKISKISKKFKIFIAFQNLHKISKFSKNFKILN